MREKRPYLSVVVVGRNDDYGFDFGKRLQTYIHHMAKLDRLCPDLFELVFVEWNPPADKPLLKDAFDWSGITNCRIVTFSSTLHHTLANADKKPLFEFFAKNVGVRRARGEFILVSNPDILFSDELFGFLNRRDLDPGAYYRADRHDFWPGPCFSAASDAIYKTACAHVFNVQVRHRQDHTLPITEPTDGKPMDEWAQSEPMPGDLILEPSVFMMFNRDTGLFGLHANAGGDFLLMHRDAWHKLKAYGERPDYNSQLDGLIIAYARSSGLLQIGLQRPYFILHMDHSRVEAKSRPDVPYSLIDDEFKAIEKFGIRPENPDNWGFADHTLPEWSPTKAP